MSDLVKVKPLVWRDGIDAVTPVGTYLVMPEDGRKAKWLVYFDGRVCGRLGEHPTRRAAKEAVQADCAARIMAAIDTTEADALRGEVERLRAQWTAERDKHVDAMYIAGTNKDYAQGVSDTLDICLLDLTGLERAAQAPDAERGE